MGGSGTLCGAPTERSGSQTVCIQAIQRHLQDPLHGKCTLLAQTPSAPLASGGPCSTCFSPLRSWDWDIPHCRTISSMPHAYLHQQPCAFCVHSWLDTHTIWLSPVLCFPPLVSQQLD